MLRVRPRRRHGGRHRGGAVPVRGDRAQPPVRRRSARRARARAPRRSGSPTPTAGSERTAGCEGRRPRLRQSAHHDPRAAPAADRPSHHRVARGAGADGRHHQPRLPPAVPRVRRRRGRRRAVPAARTSLYVSEMITSRALVERTPESMRLIEHDPQENPRSIQLYGVDPATVGAACGCSSPRTAPTTSTSTSAARCPRSPARAGERRCRGRPSCSAPSSARRSGRRRRTTCR